MTSKYLRCAFSISHRFLGNSQGMWPVKESTFSDPEKFLVARQFATSIVNRHIHYPAITTGK